MLLCNIITIVFVHLTIAIPAILIGPQNAFYCDDVFLPFKEETITVIQMIWIIIAITFFEYCIFGSNKMHIKIILMINLFVVVNALKYWIKAPRPNFPSYCGIQWHNETCIENGTWIQSHKRIDDYGCANIDATYSMPSGHSAFIFFEAFVCIVYLFTVDSNKIISFSFTCVVGALSICVAASRQLDHMHSWNDIALGAIIAFLHEIMFLVLTLCPSEKKDDDYDSRI